MRFKPYGFILLSYKPVGRGKFFDRTLANKKYNLVRNVLAKCLKKVYGKARIGFDCCFVNGIIEMESEFSSFDFEVVEGCSALRNSLAVGMDLDVVPCSFIDYSIGNLKKDDFHSIWFGKKANKFRSKLESNAEKKACNSCDFKRQCFGGCPEFELARCSK